MDPREVPRDGWAAARVASGAVAARWRTSAPWLALADMFDDVAASSLAIARDRALALLSDDRWARDLLAPLVAALAADPLFEPPLKVGRERGRTGAVLFESPAARVSASVIAAPAAEPPRIATVVLPGQVVVTRYVCAGGARIRRWRVDDDRLAELAPLFPADGDVAIQDGRCEGHAIAGSTGDVVVVTVVLCADAAPVAREYRVDDGSLIRTASTDEGASRAAMLLTLLRVSGRSDAPDVFDAAARDPAPHARWSAMREWLALDAAAATPRLRAMASGDPDAEVRALAGTTLALVRQRMPACRG